MDSPKLDVSDSPDGALDVVGQRHGRADGTGLVTGRQRYVADGSTPGELHVKATLSPYPNARILGIDTAAAAALPGVVAVVTHEDVPLETNRHGLYVKDQPVLCDDHVRYVGDPVAAVAAVDERTAAHAVSLIEVDYEPLPPITDPRESLAEGAAEIHTGGNEAAITEAHGHCVIRKGDWDGARRAAARVITTRHRTQVREHAPMETHASVAHLDADGKVVIHTCSQAPHLHQLSICEILQLPLHKVRLVGGRVGGGFGSKNELLMDHITGLLALRTGRTVKWVWTREEESLVSTKDQAYDLTYHTAVDEDGMILGRKVEAVRDNGAYTVFGTDAITKMGCYAPGPYRIPSYDYDGRVAYTNKPPSAAMRGYNVADAHFAAEVHTDAVARAVGLDPLAFRLRNLLAEGDEGATGAPIEEVTIGDCMTRAVEVMGWRIDRERVVRPASIPTSDEHARGYGICAGWQGVGATGGGDPSTAEVEVLADGSVVVRTGVVEIGAGEGTSLTMIAAEELGVPMDGITIVLGDTERTPFDLGTLGNRITWIAGNAVRRAAADCREKLLDTAAEMLEVDRTRVRLRKGIAASVDDPSASLTIAELAGAMKFGQGRPIIGTGGYLSSAVPLDEATGLGAATEAVIFAAFLVEVEVDCRTGQVDLVRSVLVHDVGRAINPLFVEGQMDGGMAFGIGNALMEEFLPEYPSLRQQARGLHHYKIPTAMDMATGHTNVILEIPSKKGPFGAKALGEYTANLQAPAIINAINDALGTEISDLPATPPRVLAAIKARATEVG